MYGELSLQKEKNKWKRDGKHQKFPKKIVYSKKINEKERAKGKESDRKEPHKDTSGS